MSGAAESLAALLAEHRLIPVVGLTSVAEAAPMAEALIGGGLPIIEVTLRQEGALETLRAIAEVDDLIVGAGTVRTAAQMGEAVAAGACFVVSPCLTPDLAAAARDLGVPFLPGVATATEIQLAVDEGFTIVKFFPAETTGGVAGLRALAAPFHDVRFVPTGGITSGTAPDYLALPQVLAVGGSWMVPTVPRIAGDWQAVTAAVRAARSAAHEPARTFT